MTSETGRAGTACAADEGGAGASSEAVGACKEGGACKASEAVEAGEADAACDRKSLCLQRRRAGRGEAGRAGGACASCGGRAGGAGRKACVAVCCCGSCCGSNADSNDCTRARTKSVGEEFKFLGNSIPLIGSRECHPCHWRSALPESSSALSSRSHKARASGAGSCSSSSESVS